MLSVLALATAHASAPAFRASNEAGPLTGARYPALSPDGTQLAFSRDGDIWRCPATGGRATRLTVHAAYDTHPLWSPDGKWLAFSSNRYRSQDVFVMPTAGGGPTRLTCHPADDLACDWSPDSKKVLYSSSRAGSRTDLYEVSVADGTVRRVTREPRGARLGRYTQDGRRIAVMAGWQDWWQTSYRGSAHAGIGVVRLPDGPGNGQANARASMGFIGDWDGFDGLPAVGGGVLWLVSTRSGSSEIWKTDLDGRSWMQVTRQGGPGISWLSSSLDGARLVYERGGRLWLIGARHPEAVAEVRVEVAGDIREERVSPASQNDGFRGLAVSPDGKQLALVAAGDLWTADIGGGDARRLTVGEKVEGAPAWSPDGKRLAYVARPSGRTDVFTRDASPGAPVRVTDDDAWESDPIFSPDGARLAFVRRGGSGAGLVVRRLAGQPGPGVALEAVVAPDGEYGGYSWSPDGRWLAFSRQDERGYSDIHLVASVGGTAVNVTRSAGVLSDPRWLPAGTTVVCSGVFGGRIGVFAIPLRRAPMGAASASPPQARRGAPPDRGGGEEGPSSQRRRPRAPGGAGGPAQDASPGVPPWPLGGPVTPTERVIVDFDGIHERLRLLAPTPKAPTGLVIAPDGQSAVVTAPLDSGVGLVAVNVSSRAVLPLCPTNGGTGQAVVLPDGSGLAWLDGAGAVQILRRGSSSPALLPVACSYERDRRAEARRLLSDVADALRRAGAVGSTAPSDVDAMARAWAAVAEASDASEDTGHAAYALAGQLGAVRFGASALVPGADLQGCLGLAFDDAYQGPGVRVSAVAMGGPADLSGGPVVSGEYIHAIDGRPCMSPEQVWSRLQGTADRSVEVTIGTAPPVESPEPQPGVRKLNLRAITFAAELALWEADAAARNAERVAVLSSGTVRYVRIARVGGDSIEDVRRRALGGLGGVRSLIVDLRGADGSEGIAGTLAVLADAAGGTTGSSQPADGRTRVRGLALVFLVDERTVGAAEALVCLASEAGLGKVVGTPLPGLACALKAVSLVGNWRISVPGLTFRGPDGQALPAPKPAADGAAGDAPDVWLARAVELALGASR